MAFTTVYYKRRATNILYPIKYQRLMNSSKQLFIVMFAITALCTSSMAIAFERGYNSDSGNKNITLSTQVKKAIDSGVALTFQCNLRINKTLGLLSWPEGSVQHSFLLTHHSLSNRYLVHTNGGSAPKNFHSIRAATDYITEQSIKFFDTYSSDKENTQMRVAIDKFKLPGPIRLNAFIADDWNIDTGWISWTPAT